WSADGAGKRTGWTIAAGDLVRDDMPVWPRGLPRRPLPAGWSAARGTPEKPQDFAAPLPQGVGAALIVPPARDDGERDARERGLAAYALRAWNPVDAGGAPPWRAAWNLRHAAAGAEVSLPWTAGLHVAETRVARGADEAL